MAAKGGKTNRIKVEKKWEGVVTRDPEGHFNELLTSSATLRAYTFLARRIWANQGNRQTQRRTEVVVGTEEV
jgi:hypothetical protein